MGKFVPLSIPNFEGNEEKYVLDAVHQGWVSTGGAYIAQLEEKMAEFLDASRLVLSAQQQACGFYEKLGYQPVGKPYLDEFCPHIRMEKAL